MRTASDYGSTARAHAHVELYGIHSHQALPHLVINIIIDIIINPPPRTRRPVTYTEGTQTSRQTHMQAHEPARQLRAFLKNNHIATLSSALAQCLSHGSTRELNLAF